MLRDAGRSEDVLAAALAPLGGRVVEAPSGRLLTRRVARRRYLRAADVTYGDAPAQRPDVWPSRASLADRQGSARHRYRARRDDERGEYGEYGGAALAVLGLAPAGGPPPGRPLPRRAMPPPVGEHAWSRDVDTLRRLVAGLRLLR